MANSKRIKELIRKASGSVRAMAQTVGMSEAGLRQAIERGFEGMNAAAIYDLAGRLNLRIEDLMDLPALRGASDEALPIRFRVGAGHWRENQSSQMILGERNVIPIPGVPLDQQWLELMEGDSMNRMIPEGALLHCVSHDHRGYKHNDIVIVNRSRFDGQLVERSAKQVVITSHGPEFWPRSTNPEWVDPVRLGHNTDTDTATIAAIVKKAYLDFDR